MHAFLRIFLPLIILHMSLTAMHVTRIAKKTPKKTVPTRRYSDEPKKITSPEASTSSSAAPIQNKECTCIKPYLIFRTETLDAAKDQSIDRLNDQLKTSRFNYSLATQQLAAGIIFYKDTPSIQQQLCSLQAHLCPHADTCCKGISYELTKKPVIFGIGISATGIAIISLIPGDIIGILCLGTPVGILGGVLASAVFSAFFDQTKKTLAMTHYLNNKTDQINNTLHKIILANNSKYDAKQNNFSQQFKVRCQE